MPKVVLHALGFVVGGMHVHSLFGGHGVKSAQPTGPLVVPSEKFIMWFLRFSVAVL
jgi:hypothetical protein